MDYIYAQDMTSFITLRPYYHSQQEFDTSYYTENKKDSQGKYKEVKYTDGNEKKKCKICEEKKRRSLQQYIRLKSQQKHNSLTEEEEEDATAESDTNMPHKHNEKVN